MYVYIYVYIHFPCLRILNNLINIIKGNFSYEVNYDLSFVIMSI